MFLFVICKIFLSLFFILTAPLFFLSALPIYIFRFFISKIGRYYKQDFDKMLTASSTIFGSDNIYHGKPSDTIITHCILEGQFDLDEFRQLFMKRVIQLGSSTQQDQLQNPELQQSVSPWMGFLFWKWDTIFDIKNHVKMFSSSSSEIQSQGILYDANDLASIGESLMCQPFAENKSPWEIILFNNIRGDKNGSGKLYCGLILHVHHCVLDGFSMLKLLIVELGLNEELNVAQPAPGRIEYQHVLKTFKKFICAPYDIVSATIEQSDQLNEFHLPLSKLSLRANAAVSSPISLKKLKEIKNNLQKQDHSVPTTLYGLILTAYAAGLRKFLIENQFEIPKKIRIGISLAKPNHPTKLRNHFTSCCITIPFDPKISINKRLELIEQSILHQKESVVPDFVFNLVILTGSLFTWMIRLAKSVNQATGALSNLPGPNLLVNIADKRMVEFWPTVGMVGNVAIGCVASTYNGQLRLAVRIDESIVPSSKIPASKLIDYIVQEFDHFDTELAV